MSSRHLRLFATVVALGWVGAAVALAMFVINFSPSETSDPSAPNLELPPTIEPDTRSRPIATVDENGATVITEDTP